MRAINRLERGTMIGSFARWGVGLLCVALWDTSSAQAQATRNIVPKPAGENHWAILVNAAQVGGIFRESYRANDVKLLAATLPHCGYSTHRILAMTANATESGSQPSQANLMEQVPRFLRKLGAEDRLLVYFAGRAFRDPKGELYLAPSDCDFANLDSPRLAVSWLRQQLTNCPAQRKMLVLDVSAGDWMKSLQAIPVSGQEVASAFQDMENVAVLASCRDSQQSLDWKAVDQSLFGFWFNQALAGHADKDADRQVTVDELCGYVAQKVGHTAQEVFHTSQTPVVQCDEKVKTQAVSQPKLTALREALKEMADKVAVAAGKSHLSRLAVPEFRPLGEDSQTVQLLGGTYGLLGRSCAIELEQRLKAKAETGAAAFALIPHRPLHSLLARGGFSPASWHTGATRGITVHGKSLEAVVLGSFCVRTGPVVSLRCDLLRPGRAQHVARFQTTAFLEESDLASLGHSGTVKPKPKNLQPPKAPSPDNPKVPGEPTDGGIPQFEPNGTSSDFRVTIDVGDEAREAIAVGANQYVALAKDEVYTIVVENRRAEAVYLRLLVDGLNTLPERVEEESALEGRRQNVYRPAQFVPLDQARAWRMEARPADAEASVYEIQGFYRRLGDGQYEWQTFKVVQASESLAYQQAYQEQIGLITAAFYQVRPEQPARSRSRGSGEIGTGPGEKRQGKVEEYREAPVGHLLTVINIHYLEPEAFERLQHSQEKAAGEAGEGSQPPVDPGPKEEENKTSETTSQGPPATLLTRHLAAAASDRKLLFANESEYNRGEPPSRCGGR